jgi:hypothetical protein
MSSREEQVLALARRAWESGLANDEEVEAGAQRVARRMRARPSRPPRLRRPVAAFAFAVVFGGALAYAASGGVHWPGSKDTSGPGSAVVTPLHGAVRAGVGSHFFAWKAPVKAPSAAPDKAKSAPAEDETSTAPDRQNPQEMPSAAPSALPVPSETKSGASAGDNGKAAAAAASTWRDVDRALDAKDDARAKHALEGLSKSKDVATRAKAQLGLAQLARSKHDCRTARALALEVVKTPGVEASVSRRAQEIVLMCD